MTNQTGVELTLRPPTKADALGVHRLVKHCPPLDLNSVYLYLLVCTHHAETSVVAAGEDGEIHGFISAYRLMHAPDVLFIWQVAVGEAARGQGLARRMVQSILARPACASVRFLETTVGPENGPSRALFASVAKSLGTALTVTPHFTPADLGGDHEAEELLRIGPFS